MNKSASRLIGDRVIQLVNVSKKCEPSGYLFNIATHFLIRNNYILRDHAAHPYAAQVLINTCCVTKSKIEEAEHIIHAVLQHPEIKKAVIFGCYVKFADRFKTDPRCVFVAPKELYRLNEIFDHQIPIENIVPWSLAKGVLIPYQQQLTRKNRYVLIGQGCTHHCSYCNIKRAKGDMSSRPIADIIKEINDADERNSKGLVLLADDCGSYGRDIGSNLVSLVAAIQEQCGLRPLMISTIFPGDLCKLYARLRPWIEKGAISYINVPLQSGSDRILRLMQRGYLCRDVLGIVRDMKRCYPRIWIYSHFIINFPTETHEDFVKSLRASTAFDELLFITYSDNPGTRANRISPKVSIEIQNRRIQIARHYVRRLGRGVVVDKV